MYIMYICRQYNTMPIKNFREKLTRISIVMLSCNILKLYLSFLIYKLEAYKNWYPPQALL